MNSKIKGGKIIPNNTTLTGRFDRKGRLITTMGTQELSNKNIKGSCQICQIDPQQIMDIENITLLDTARTNIDKLVYQAAKEAGLGVMGDRIPSQGYYERSDQVSFAKKGVPAVNFKMSMAAFDERISTYYHQPNDEFDSIDRDYVYKYWISYIRSAELISNWDQIPYWMPGDKFEEAGNKLYSKKQ